MSRNLHGHNISKAFVLAAGLGTRMRPLTDHVPKPLVMLDGRALIDHVLDRLLAAGIDDLVVNVHYKAEQIEAHLAARQARVPKQRITISDERDLLLDTGGGVLKALGHFGDEPFLVCNSDTVWLERGTDNLGGLIRVYNGHSQDAHLLLASRAYSLGYSGNGDFKEDAHRVLQRPARGESVRQVFAGVSIATARLLREMPPATPFSLNRVWDRAIVERRIYGSELIGHWLHVGDPLALADAEKLIADARQT